MKAFYFEYKLNLNGEPKLGLRAAIVEAETESLARVKLNRWYDFNELVPDIKISREAERTDRLNAALTIRKSII